MSADGLDNSKPSTLSKLNLPDAPPGDPPLHHVAVKYREQLEKVLAGPWLVIATGGLPSAAESIVDFPPETRQASRGGSEARFDASLLEVI